MNKDAAKRNKIIGIAGNYCGGGIEHFRLLDLESLKQLVDEGFIDLEECQNCSPSVGDILEFMEANPRFTAHGYAVSPERDDYRVSLEGVEFDKRATREELIAFAQMFGSADEFEVKDNFLFAWYD